MLATCPTDQGSSKSALQIYQLQRKKRLSVKVWLKEAQAAALLLIADIRLDERVGDPGLHSVQGTFKVSGLDVLSFDVLLQGQEGSLSAYCCYLGQETDTDIQLSGRAVRPLNKAEAHEQRSTVDGICAVVS